MGNAEPVPRLPYQIAALDPHLRPVGGFCGMIRSDGEDSRKFRSDLSMLQRGFED